jgi:ATP-dependent RNA helicase SUPV3L1/SUV3
VPEPTSVIALLGPTNTGKTHRAVERMLEHHTGMIGLPLRLLAREIYDRVTSRIGESEVALVTGEEKRMPRHPRYWVCTVEAMPVERSVDFLAVDEIQLAAHAERGHVFTSRLLGARGKVETWFLGSDTMRPITRALLPHAETRGHPRLSRLSFTGTATLGQLPPRSAVVAFSMARVYELAERLKRRRGGAAVVLGALSPRARNAQVAMYQAGEVDHMVATDAIGMGLNLDLRHVAFADLEKFDGRETRGLDSAEMAQIAGRAGRYTNDGSFGTLRPETLPERLSRAIEQHRFTPERRLIWRSSELDLESVDGLIASLSTPPKLEVLRLVERADDFAALVRLARRPEIRARTTNPAAVALLWEVCQIPDYRQLMPEAHAELVGQVFLQLSDSGRVDAAWLGEQVRRLDDASGDIDTLLGRMAFIRTFTYISNHGNWVEAAEAWQEKARAIEDRLSDALHLRLVERFVERHKPGRSRGTPVSPARPDSPFARLAELRREAPPEVEDDHDGWIVTLCDAPHDRFRVDVSGAVFAGERRLGSLSRGADPLRPDIKLELESLVGAGLRARLERRLLAFARDWVREAFQPLADPRVGELSAAGRGLVYQLERALGTLPSSAARAQIEALTESDLAIFEALGVVIGSELVYLPALLKPHAVEQRAALLVAWTGSERVALPPRGAVSMRVGASSPAQRSTLRALGYPVFGPRALRADVVERAKRELDKGPPDEAASALLSRWLGCPAHELGDVLRALGSSMPRRRRSRRRRRPRRPADSTRQ